MTLVRNLYDTGQFQTVDVRALRGGTSPDGLSETDRWLISRHWPLSGIGAGFTAVAVVCCLIFGLEATFPLTPGYTILIVVGGVSGVAATGAFLGAVLMWLSGWQVLALKLSITARIDNAVAHRVADIQAVQHALVENRQKLTDLAAVPGEVRGRIEVLSQHLDRRCDAMGKHFGAEVAQLRRILDERLRELEARVGNGTANVGDEGSLKYDDRYLAGLADGLAGRTLGEGGKVLPLNSSNGHGRSS